MIDIGSDGHDMTEELKEITTPQIPSLYPQLTIEQGENETSSLPPKPLFTIGINHKSPKH